MKRATLVIALVMLMFVGTGTAFAYWDSGFEQMNSDVINIGVGATLEVEQTVTPPAGKFLVPLGAFMGTNDVNEVVFTYTINLNKAGRVAITATDIKINNDFLNNELVLIDMYVTAPGLTPVSTLTVDLIQVAPCCEVYEAEVTVKVMLLEPIDEAQYLQVINQPITFVLEFSAEEIV